MEFDNDLLMVRTTLVKDYITDFIAGEMADNAAPPHADYQDISILCEEYYDEQLDKFEQDVDNILESLESSEVPYTYCDSHTCKVCGRTVLEYVHTCNSCNNWKDRVYENHGIPF